MRHPDFHRLGCFAFVSHGKENVEPDNGGGSGGGDNGGSGGNGDTD